MNNLLQDAANRAFSYLNGLGERGVAPTDEALLAMSGFTGALPKKGLEAKKVIAKLDLLGSPATVASAGPRYFGFVTGGSLPVALAANWLAGAWDQNAFSSQSSPLGAELEVVCLEWLRQIFGVPDIGLIDTSSSTTASFRLWWINFS